MILRQLIGLFLVLACTIQINAAQHPSGLAYFQLAQQKKNNITISEFVTWYENYWNSHKTEFVNYKINEFLKNGQTRAQAKTAAENAFLEQKNKVNRSNINKDGFAEAIRALVMTMQDPLRDDFLTQIWQWLTNH